MGPISSIWPRAKPGIKYKGIIQLMIWGCWGSCPWGSYALLAAAWFDHKSTSLSWRSCASCERSVNDKYFLLWNSFSSSADVIINCCDVISFSSSSSWSLVNAVRRRRCASSPLSGAIVDNLSNVDSSDDVIKSWRDIIRICVDAISIKNSQRHSIKRASTVVMTSSSLDVTSSEVVTAP